MGPNTSTTRLFPTARAWLAAAAMVVSVTPSCGSNGVVGGDCADGYTRCGDACVDLSSDPANCGACGNVCSAGQVCHAGHCTGAAGAGGSGQGGISGGSGHAGAGNSQGGEAGNAGAAGMPEGGNGGTGEAGAEAGGTSGGGGSSGATNGGIGGCPMPSGGSQCPTGGSGGTSGNAGTSGSAGRSGAAGASGSPGVSGAAGMGAIGGVSGAAGTAGASGMTGGAGASGTSGRSGASGASGAGTGGASGGGRAAGGASGNAGNGGAGGCSFPLVDCMGTCVDQGNDPDNCGSCGHLCPTGVCQSGKCLGAAVGHEVLIGIDYTGNGSANSKLLLTNAVYLGSGSSNAWRVLGFDPFLSPTVAKVDAILQAGAASHGIANLTITHETDPGVVLAVLSVMTYDAIVVYDEPTAPVGALGMDGAMLGASLGAFASAGGNVVVLSGGTGTNEMWDFVAQSMLFATTGFTEFPSPPATTLANNAPTDGVGLGVTTFFASSPNTGAWTMTVDSSTVVVIKTQTTGQIVAVHRAVTP